MGDYRTRAIVPGDLETICRHREEMFADAGWDRAGLQTMTAAFREWVRPRLGDGSYFGWITEVDAEAVAGLGMLILDWPPHALHPAHSRRAYVLNVFVEPQHRRKGLAAELMERAREETLRRGITLMALHATPKGRELYRKLGWTESSEMFLRLPGTR